MLSVSLSGFINYLDLNNPLKPLRIVKVSFESNNRLTCLVNHIKTKTILTFCFFSGSQQTNHSINAKQR